METLSMESLPNGVLALILSRTTPRDVARLSAVSKSFNSAAYDDLVWKAFLPLNVKDVVKDVPGESLVYDSLKELFFCLGGHHLLGDGTEGFWIDRETGGLCRTFSAKTLNVTWMCTHRYWQWDQAEGSRFQEVARLRDVCWLEITGEINTDLPPGVYTLAWVLKVDKENYGMNVDVTFSTTDALEGSEEARKFQIKPKQSPTSSGSSDDSWSCYNVRHFTVERANGGDGSGMGKVKLNFSLREINRGNWKRGLLVDGVVIRAGKHDLEENVEENADERDWFEDVNAPFALLQGEVARRADNTVRRGHFSPPLSLRSRFRRF